jgi:hypothetical protein
MKRLLLIAVALLVATVTALAVDPVRGTPWTTVTSRPNFSATSAIYGPKSNAWTHTVVGSHTNLIVGTYRESGLPGSDILMTAGGGLFWKLGALWNFSDHDSTGDELIMDGSPNIGIIPGANGRTQMGSGGPNHDWVFLNHDNNSVNVNVGNTWSKALAFMSYSYVNTTLRRHQPGIMGFSYTTNPITSYPFYEAEMRFYSGTPMWVGQWNSDAEPNRPGAEIFRAGPYGLKLRTTSNSTPVLDISGDGYPALTWNTNKVKFYYNASAGWFFLEKDSASPLIIDSLNNVTFGVTGKTLDLIGNVPHLTATKVSGSGVGLTNLPVGLIYGQERNHSGGSFVIPESLGSPTFMYGYRMTNAGQVVWGVPTSSGNGVKTNIMEFHLYTSAACSYNYNLGYATVDSTGTRAVAEVNVTGSTAGAGYARLLTTNTFASNIDARDITAYAYCSSVNAPAWITSGNIYPVR